MGTAKKRVPELRFEGFNEEWEERLLKDVSEINPNSPIPHIFKYVDLESVKGTHLISYKTMKKSTAPSRAQRLAKQGDIFYQTVRPYQQNNYYFALSFTDYVFSTGYAQVRPYTKGLFVFSYMQNEKFLVNVLDRCTGTGYPAISPTDLSSISLFIPSSSDEQTLIGNFFKQLDEVIHLLGEELSKYKNLKKAYLAKMFPKEGEKVPELRFPGFSGKWE